MKLFLQPKYKQPLMGEKNSPKSVKKTFLYQNSRMWMMVSPIHPVHPIQLPLSPNVDNQSHDLH